MKNFHVQYMVYNEETYLFNYQSKVMTTKELCMFLIDNAFNRNIIISRIKECAISV